MLSWVVKVVPQPPELPPKKVDEPTEEKPTGAPPPVEAPPPVIEKKVTFQDECKPEVDKPQQEPPAAEGNSPAGGSQPGMLTWISSALPQPVVSPKLSRANSTTKEENPSSSKPEDEKGMMSWIAQGLEKVVPHPDLKTKEPPAAEQPAQVGPPAAAPAEPQVTAAKAESEDVKPPPPPRSAKEAEQQPNMVGWIVSGIGRMLPQPVQKQDAGSSQVHNSGTSPLK